MEDRSFLPGIFLSHFDLARPIDWPSVFGNDHPLHLEIGFGLGEFLVDEAARCENENLIGIEADWARLCRCLGRVSAGARKSPSFGKNIRLLRVDATVALQRLFTARSLGRVTCLFPCPWPKKGHVRHRLFSQDFLCLLNSRMRDGGEVNLVTDWEPYARWVEDEVAGTGFDFQVSSVGPRFQTKFEKKWRAAGQESFFQLLLTKRKHRDRPVLEDVEMRARFVKDFVPEKFSFENIVGETSVIYKDFIYDPAQSVGMVRLIVAEPFLTQHVWVAVIKTKGQWCVAKADGHSALPTSGVALAIEEVAKAAGRTIGS